MKKILSVFVVGFLMIFLPSGVSQAEDLEKISDRFYAGLADIIERNMDDPQTCVKEVEDYYQANQKSVRQIRKAAEKAMAHIAPMLEKYKSMSEEELDALKRQQKAMEPPRMSPGVARYSQALRAFTMKYPQYGMEITKKAMQLVPGFDSYEFQNFEFR